MKPLFSRVLLLLPLFFAACTKAEKAAAPAASADAQKLVLAADPGPAEGVVAAKAKGARNDVVVEGRLADVVKGRFAFTLMDVSLPYCGETNKEDNCKTPWDYCCDKPKIPANSLFVEVRGADGKPVASPSLPDLRLLDKVKVKGKVEADTHGNLVLLATGVFRTERPQLPDDLKWPQ